MKKMLKAAALIAAAAMVLGFVSCSDSDDAEDLGTLLVIKNKIDEADAAKETAKEAGKKDETAKATAATYDFTGLAGSAFSPALTLAANTTIAVGEGTNTVTTSVGAAKIYIAPSKAGGKNDKSMRIRTDANSKSTAINYNGGETSSIASGVTIADLSRYVSIDVDGACTVTAKFKGVKSSEGTNTISVGLFDSDGKKLGDLKEFTAGVGCDETTVTGKVSAATTVYVVMSRNVAGAKGGIDLYNISVQP